MSNWWQFLVKILNFTTYLCLYQHLSIYYDAPKDFILFIFIFQVLALHLEYDDS